MTNLVSVAAAPASTLAKFDDNKAEAFAHRLVGTLSEAALALMTSIGHRTGLFDALGSHPASTSAQLADAAGLAERYVREWLGVMVTSGVIEHDAATRRYTLPPEHAAFLTRAAGADNIAVTSQFIGVAAGVEDQMVQRFRDGEGLHYHHFGRFHEVMAEDSAQTVVAALNDAILPLVPGLVERLHEGIDVVDVGCGGGRAMLHLARCFPASRFTGIDLCADAFAGVQAEATELGLQNLRFEAKDLSTADTLGRFDLVTAFDAVHDQKDPLGLLQTVRRSLAEGGVLLMQDIGASRDVDVNCSNPFAPLLYTLSCMHCTPISIGQGGPGLGTMWGTETAHEFLAEAGFGRVEMHRLPHDPINAYFIARP